MNRSQRNKSQYASEQNTFVGECKDNPLKLSEKMLDGLLSTLCIELGYCLSPKARATILNNPPTDPDSFARRVMELEGVGSEDKEMFAPVFEHTYNVFRKASGKNT
ncbi:hypothetical protein [Kangiella sp. M94]